MSKPQTPNKFNDRSKQTDPPVESNNTNIHEISHKSRNLTLQSHISKQSKEENVNSGENLVLDAKNQLDNMIEDLNGRLVNHFKMKEQSLLNQYKEELIEQQKLLTELKNNTNQEQIRNKMLLRKAELQKQRNHLIQTNMFFSQKCQQYKHKYSKLIQESNDLQRQIKFLDQQIDTANAKRINMIEQVEKSNVQQTDRSDLPIFTSKKQEQSQYTERKKQQKTIQKTASVRKIAKSLHMSNFSKNTKSGRQLKNLKQTNPQVFEKGIIQKLFEDSVQDVKNRRKSKRTMPNLKGEEFTEYQKRAIMEIFLSNQEVKKKIYEIIFENSDKTGRGLKADPMIKINFDEIGM